MIPHRFVDADTRKHLDCVVSKIQGLYLTGQDVVLCGVTLCQVSLFIFIIIVLYISLYISTTTNTTIDRYNNKILHLITIIYIVSRCYNSI